MPRRLARALALSAQGQGRDWLVLESESAIGTGTSSRNSEVIHAGIYYPRDSLKARWCVRGKHLLYEYAQERHVPHQRCGKLIVATHASQVAQLELIAAKAAANGVNDLVTLSAKEARAMEPALHCLAALHSPSTGIVDSHAYMLALQGDFENAGGMVAYLSAFKRATITPQGYELTLADGTQVACDVLVNASGLNAPLLARCIEGLDTTGLPQAAYCKGNYFTLAGRSPFSRLIYPVPEAAGLGVHLTLDLGGQARCCCKAQAACTMHSTASNASAWPSWSKVSRIALPSCSRKPKRVCPNSKRCSKSERATHRSWVCLARSSLL